jgi:hypothetical protein
MSVEYVAVCECGRSNTVLTNQMGGRHPCYCGFMLLIPTAEEFARNPVLTAYPSLLRKVSAQVEAGLLSGVTDCQRCGASTDREVLAVVACESSRSETVGGSGVWSVLLTLFTLILTILFAPLVVFLWMRPEGVTENYGRDTSVSVPIRLCLRCHRRLKSRAVPVLLGILAGGAVLTAVVAVFAGWWAVIPAVVAMSVVGLLVRANRKRRKSECKDLLAAVPVYTELGRAYRFAEVLLPPVE